MASVLININNMNIRRSNFKAVSQHSMQKEMQLIRNGTKQREDKDMTQKGTVKRIIFVGKNSSYHKYMKFIVGKKVELIRKPASGGSQSWVCRFLFDEDSKALNKAAGWSDSKNEYLFDSIKIK